ncbi:MAG: endo alpha-1,4 polygalactosaminidase [Acetobacteraceae bacterium]|jgi:polysaccharide biosynthesis protein PelA
MRRAILQACAAMCTASFAWATGSRAATQAAEQQLRWIVFYGQIADEQALAALASYDIVVLDPMFAGSIATVARDRARVCGYLSLGEIRKSDSFYHRADPAALLEENPAWPGTRRIDVRHPSWKALVLTEIIPSIAAKGFTGLLLDTLDTPPYLEQLDPKGKAGMREAAVDLVKAIHNSRPNMMVIMNRGYALLPNLIGSIDGIVAESLLTTVDQHGGYKWNEPAQVAQQMALLAPALHSEARLPILSLDYWDPADTRTIAEIYRLERELGHHPYVGTRMLDRIVPEPRP